MYLHLVHSLVSGYVNVSVRMEVLDSSLTSGHTVSCGCKKYEHKVNSDCMFNKEFGFLKVVSRAPSHKIPSGSVYDMWNCECKCGNKTVTFGRHLRMGKIKFCGCQRVVKQAEAKPTPKAELWTMEYFEEHDIFYEYQKTFPDLAGVNGGLLSYDFYLPEYSLLIELNGLQHYKSVDWFGGEATFQKQLQHDMLKRSYAETHDYKLVVISTDHISKQQLLSYIASINL